MPKIKPHKGVSKRVKVTKSGKIKRQQAWHKHLMTHKSSNRRRRLKRAILASKAEQRRLARLLGIR